MPSPVGPFGAKGIGEQALIPTAPAILNAIHDATGVRIRRVPATPDRVRAAMLAAAGWRGDMADDSLTLRRARQATTRSAAMPARSCATSSRARPAPATATPITTANSCASIRMSSSTAPSQDGSVVPFHRRRRLGRRACRRRRRRFVTAIGAGTTYPDYKPAPFIVSSEVDGVDMVTVVTEGIFSYCGVKVKIDTDRHLGPEQRRCARRASRSAM